MIDVFISFSSRAANDKEKYKKWVSDFRQNLVESYKNNYASDLEVWDDIQKNGLGNNFISEIDKALLQSTILITILDPAYIESSQALDEVDKYTRIRNESGNQLYILKVVKLLGNKRDDIMGFINSNIVSAFFSKTGANNIEKLNAESSDEYASEINKLVVAIRKFIVEQKRKNNYEIIKDRLEVLKNQPLIYVVLGHGTLKDSRIKFINQLGGTLKRNKKLSEIKIFPDDLTLSLMDHDDLGELLFEENPYREKCLAAMLDKASATVIPIEYETNSDADEIKRNISYQLDMVKKRAQNDKKRPVYILFNIPDNLKASSPFNELINNPIYISYEHIKIMTDQNITTFIELFTKELEVIINPEEDPGDPPDEKSVYLIEYDKPIADSSFDQTELLMERQNRLAVKSQIAQMHVLIKSVDVSDDLEEAIEQYMYWLKMCDGIIIYRGIIEDERWCIDKQAATYKVLHLSNKRKLKRAVYVDPLQKKREPGEYSFFKYEVITKDPPTPELNDFLCRI